jgi:hypothetical protein
MSTTESICDGALAAELQLCVHDVRELWIAVQAHAHANREAEKALADLPISCIKFSSRRRRHEHTDRRRLWFNRRKHEAAPRDNLDDDAELILVRHEFAEGQIATCYRYVVTPDHEPAAAEDQPAPHWDKFDWIADTPATTPAA